MKMINVDFLLSGCSTRCRHCYVAGGPGPMMETGDALLCIKKLDAVAACLPEELSFTLDHEPMNHPEIVQIIRAAAAAKHSRNYHHGMTTGIGLMRRNDRETVLRSYLDCGYDVFGITVHGSAAHHDEMVRRAGAFDAMVSAARFFKAHGARLEVSLMVNRFFPEDAESITALLRELQPGYIGCVTPIYTPHGRMSDFEPFRASLEDVEALRARFPAWQQDAESIMQNAREHTVAAAVAWLKRGEGLPSLFEAPQEELYLSLHPDGFLYEGNSGAETACLGDLRTMDPEEAAGLIMKLPGNRDYGAFYDIPDLPETGTLVRVLESLPQGLVYGDHESVIYRGLAELKIPTRMDKFRVQCVLRSSDSAGAGQD